MESVLIPALTRNQILSISFTAVIFVVVGTILFLMLKSLKDNRAYHAVDLPSLENDDENSSEEKSAFSIEPSFNNEEQESFFSVEDDDEPLFDFGSSDETMPDMDDDETGVAPAAKKKGLFGNKKEKASGPAKEAKVKKTRKQKLKDQEKLAQDRVLVEEIIKSTTPKRNFDAINPLDETALDASQNVFHSHDPDKLEEEFAIDDEYKLPESELPDNLDELLLDDFEPAWDAKNDTPSVDEAYPVDEAYVDPKDFLASRGVSLQDALALEEEDDDFTPEVKTEDSAFGSSGMHDFELKETQTDAVIAPAIMNVKIPSKEAEFQSTNYVGKRRRDLPVDQEDLT